MTFDQQGTQTRTGKRMKSRTQRLLSMLSGAVLAALAMSLTPAWAQAALLVCGSNISACCKITNPGSYTVPGNFTATGSSGACIRIEAPDVTLDGKSSAIVGPGPTSSMDGLVIEPGADHASVSNLLVIHFATGIEVDAKKAALANTVEYESKIGVVINGPGTAVNNLQATNNLRNGIVINGKGLFAVDMSSGLNGGNGMVFNSTAAGPYVVDAISNSNQKAGIELKAVEGGAFYGALVQSNYTYGIWLRGTTGVSLLDFVATFNSIAGVYLGCHGDGPSSAACAPGIPRTNANILASLNTGAIAKGPSEQYGVVIDLGNSGNRVAGVTAQYNTNNDGYDGNLGCGTNIWSGNTFTSYNQSCVK